MSGRDSPKLNEFTGRELLKRLYDEAWRLHEARCLWNVKRVAVPSDEDGRHVARCLRERGSMQALRLAVRLEEASRAA